MHLLTSLDRHFPDALWCGSSRSREISPLYIERFRGPRTVSIFSKHRFWELTCVLSGNGKMLGAQQFALNPGTICLIPPHLQHSESCTEVMDTIWMGVEGSFLPTGYVKPQVVNDPELAGAVEKLWLLAQECGEPVGPELDGMTKMVLGRFFRLITQTESKQERDIVSRAMVYFDRHYGAPLSLTDMARRLGCSEGYFSRSFRQRAGISPMNYLRNVRLRQAALLLQRTELPVSEIASLTGYQDPFYLSRAFRQVYGRPPSKYRQQAHSPKIRHGSEIPGHQAAPSGSLI